MTTADLASPSVGGYYHDPTVTLSASDVWSGVATTEYTLDGGASQAYTAPFKVTGDGPHTLTYHSTDVNGNVEETKTLTFSIDTTPPVLTVSGDQTVEATGPSGAIVTYADPTAVDAISGPVTATCTPASGSTFPLGHTLVLCTATDPAGNLGSKSFDVHVPHTIAPNVITSADVVAEATSASGAKVTYPDATATDIVDGRSQRAACRRRARRSRSATRPSRARRRTASTSSARAPSTCSFGTRPHPSWSRMAT